MSFKERQNGIQRKLNQLDKAGQKFFGGIEDSIERTYEEIETIGENIYDGAKGIFVGNDDDDGAVINDAEKVQGASESDVRKNGAKNRSATSSPPGGSINFIPGETNPPWPNELEPYASYNTIFTLGVLSPEEINNPDETYVKNGIKEKYNILRSGGGLGDSKTTTAFETSGRVEYYIEDVDIESIIAPNNQTGISTGIAVSFNVVEPYSLGLFLQTLMIASKRAGYANYIEAPMLLQMDFKGWDENNNGSLAPYATRRIPIKLINVTVEADEGGSRYQCSAYAYNEMALLDEMQTIKNDISIHGEKLVDLLQKGEGSLSAVLNSDFIDQENANQKSSADRIIISFPTKNTSKNPSYTSINTDGATIDYSDEQEETFETLNYDSDIAQRIAAREFSQTNKIGNSNVLPDWVVAGELPYAIPGGPNGTYDSIKKVFDRTQKGLHPTYDSRTYRFKAGTKIEHIIQQMVLISDYGKELFEQFKQLRGELNGFVRWFRIETNVYVNRDIEQMRRIGRYPKVYVYKVVPYLAHSSRFKTPNQEMVGKEAVESQAAKFYKYIYTGENKDILDFKLEYNYAFFTAINDDQENQSGSTRTGEQANTLSRKETAIEENIKAKKEPDEGAPSVEGVVENSTQKASGSQYEDIETRTARDFHEAFINSNVDLIKLDLTIMGDPFYLPNSGVGNYNGPKTNFENMKADGSIDYQSGEVDVKVEFRTPYDYSQTGAMDYPELGDEDSSIIKAFSGLYQVIRVKHNISQNFFSQSLELIRRRNQEKTEDESDVGPVKETTNKDIQQSNTFDTSFDFTEAIGSQNR